VEGSAVREKVMTTAVGTVGDGRTEALAGLTEAVVRRREGTQALLRAARDGDAEAFVELVRGFQGAVYPFILRLVRRPTLAEDLSQDVFVRLWRHIGEMDSAATLGAWLRRVAVNAVIDHWRKEESRRRQMQTLREHPVARHVVRPSARMESQKAVDTVQAALDALPAKLRSVLLLRTVEGLSYDELAETLCISTSAVRSRLFRARHELHEILKHRHAADYLERMYRERGKAEADG
jgi:RNA polymerase sigma-70 factor (ECF subfamily)